MALLVAICLIGRHVVHSHDKCDSSKDQQDTVATNVSSTSAPEMVQRRDVFCSNGSDSGISVMTSIVEMGVLSPVQEETAAVETTNPMRKALAQSPSFHIFGGEEEGAALGSQPFSTNGGSSMREGEEEEETEGMFADAAVVAELAAAAAEQAQKPAQALISNPSSRELQQIAGGWMRSLSWRTPSSNTTANSDESEGFAREPTSKVNNDPLGPATAATVVLSPKQPGTRHPSKPPLAVAQQELAKSSTDPVTTVATNGIMTASGQETHTARPQEVPVVSKPTTVTAAPSGVVAANTQQTLAAGLQVTPIVSKPSAFTAAPNRAVPTTVQRPPKAQEAAAIVNVPAVTTAAFGIVAAPSQQSPTAEVQAAPVATEAMIPTAREGKLVPAVTQRTPADKTQVARVASKPATSEVVMLKAQQALTARAQTAPVATVEHTPVTTAQANPLVTDKEAPVLSVEPAVTRRRDDKSLVSAEEVVSGNPAVTQAAKNPHYPSFDGAIAEPELEIPYPSAHSSENGSTKVDMGEASTAVMKGREKEGALIASGKLVTGVDSAREIPTDGKPQANVSRGLHEADNKKALDIADVFPAISSAVRKALALPAFPAVKAAVRSAPTVPSPVNVQDFPLQQPSLCMHPTNAAIPPGTAQPGGLAYPEIGSNISIHGNGGAKDHSLAAVEVSSPSQQRPLTPLTTTPDRTPRVGGSLSSGLGAQWTTPLATPDRTPRESTTVPKALSTSSATKSGASNAWTVPDRSRVAAGPDSREEVSPERSSKPDNDGAPRVGMVGITPTDEAQFGWNVDPPVAMDGFPSPCEQGVPTNAVRSGDRDPPAILGRPSPHNTAAECLTEPLGSDPQSTNVLSHPSNTSGDTVASYPALDSAATFTEGPGLTMAPLATFTAGTESAPHDRPLLDTPRSWIRNPAPSPSGEGGDDLGGFGTLDGMQRQQATGGPQDSLNEVDEVTARVAEAIELTDKCRTDNNRVMHPAAGNIALDRSGQEADTTQDDRASAVEASRDAKPPSQSDHLELGRYGSRRSILDYTEGEAAEEGNAEKRDREVKALVAEALALVREADEDAIEYPTEESVPMGSE